MRSNRAVVLATRPTGGVSPGDFAIRETPVPVPEDGSVLLRNMYLSVDPGLRNLLGEKEGYLPPVPVGAPLTGSVLGKVVESRHPDIAVGDLMVGRGALAEYATIQPGPLSWKLDPVARADPALALGPLGIPGLTAYFGLVELGRAKSGQTVLVSSAAGAVGMMAVQIARLLGCRVVGIAGGDAKRRFLLDDLRLDGAIDYQGKSPAALTQALAETCPDGVDVFFDNVGGLMLDAALTVMKTGGRISLCGMVSQYDQSERHPFANLFLTISKSLSLTGFLLFDFFDRYAEASGHLHRWVRDDGLHLPQTVLDGIETYPAVFADLFTSNRAGKTLIRLAG